MLFPNAGAAQIMSFYCHQTHYWEAINGILVKYLGCEIQDVEYNDQLQVFLELTNEDIVILVRYFKDTPNEYHPWQIVMKARTSDSVSAVKVNIPEWKNNNDLSWSHSGYGVPSAKEGDYEKVVEEIINLLEPICIGSN